MSSEIWGVTVGSTLPKPNLMQDDPKKGDYIHGKEEFLSKVNRGDGNICVIDATDGWDSIDMTYAEIQESYAAGKILVLSIEGFQLDLVSADNGFVFERHYMEGTKLVTERCSLSAGMVLHNPRAIVLDLPTDDHINELIDTALGVIENGTY